MTVRRSNPIYHDESAAREYLEALRWPDGPICPHCSAADNAVKLQGKSTRPGLCRDCRKPFSVMVGAMFERSKIPLTKWLLASHLLAASTNAMSTRELHRALGVTDKSAWLMARRIRRQQASRIRQPAADRCNPLLPR